MDTLVPREVLTFGPGRHVLRRSDYPWLQQVFLYAAGGQGGHGPNGEPGRPGTVQGVRLPADRLPETLRITVEAGAPGVGGGGPGRDGFVLVELYDVSPAGCC